MLLLTDSEVVSGKIADTLKKIQHMINETFRPQGERAYKYTIKMAL